MLVFNRVLQGSKFFTTTDLKDSKALSPENIPLPTNIYKCCFQHLWLSEWVRNLSSNMVLSEREMHIWVGARLVGNQEKQRK